MVEIELDGQKVEVLEGSMVMHAAEKAGTYIPHFCYHKKLSIAANCRMCLVDVEKAPKPMPACATPVTQGMIVRTKTDKAIKAQQSVMEFLLINHPLDCPICDQGGECQLQDLAVGYGGSSSRYEEEKRVVFHKDVGPLISMQEMSRCIHCTRCVRFGQEVAGVMELGMSHRGEHAEIETFVGQSVDSELSGNMIDICPVGALTSKPFRYSARTWELSRRKSIAPHDSSGANLVVQVKSNEVLRVVPLENEDVNECWIADRDRFSYEALNSADRLRTPMIKQGGEWKEVDWQTALEYVANGLNQISKDHGASSIGALVSPHSTLEELHLASTLVRSLGSDNIDYRLRNAEFAKADGIRYLGTSIASLSQLQRVLVVGSNLRKDHPLFAQRIRQAQRNGAQVNAITSKALFNGADAWAMPVKHADMQDASGWAQSMANVAAAIAAEKGVTAPANGQATPEAQAIAKSLLGGERKAILLGNAAAHHANASSLLSLAKWIAENTGATYGYLTEAANTVGAQWAKAQPQTGGLNAAQMLAGGLKAVLLLNTEPVEDSAAGAKAVAALAAMQMVVTLSPFKTNMAFSDVLLPIAPFTETSGSFVNAEGRLQSFHAVVKPLAETRPAWKVLRVLANMLGLPQLAFETSQDVLKQISATPLNLSNAGGSEVRLAGQVDTPCVASIYQLDSLVRRAPSLQLTADARNAAASAQAVAQGVHA
ncbi:MAG: NADH-quinone oxidoreductase subunit NuoG [Burkholderiales bacterium]|nr:NADH-quinone oxidoreductase subunit NuoG [Burkholderiales bacterium]